MRYFSIRVLSSLMVATIRQWELELAERSRDSVFGAPTYDPVYKVLLSAVRFPSRFEERLRSFTSGAGVSDRVAAFRRNAEPNIRWFASEVAPKILRIERSLEGTRRSANPAFQIARTSISGGPHWVVRWQDGSERLVYLLGPSWTRRRIRALLSLLHLYARNVFGKLPSAVVIVDLKRKEVVELQERDSAMELQAVKTVQSLKIYLQTRRPAS